MTDRQILASTGYTDMNQIRPRLTELIKKGIVIEVGWQADDVTGHRVRLCDLKERYT